MKLNKDLRTIYIFAILGSIILILGWGVTEPVDSPSYIYAWDTLRSGHLDILRTPSYPIFLGICKTIAGGSFYKYAAIILQHIIFLVSIGYFNWLAFEITKRSELSFWITFFYAIYPAILTWNNCILTESLAVTGGVFLLYHSMKLYRSFSVRAMLLFLFWLSFLLFLRPSFLYLLPIYFVFWLFCLITKRTKNTAAGLICTLIVVFSQAFYIHQFNQTYGVPSPSSVSVINQYYMTRQDGLIYVDGIDNEKLKEDIIVSIATNGASTDNHSVLWDETSSLIDKYSIKDVQQVISVSMRKNPAGVLKKAGARAYKAAGRPISYSFLSGFATFFDMFGANISMLYLFLIIYALVLIIWMVRKGKLAYFSILLFMIGTSNVITVIFGAQQEWSRLILPSMPIYLLMFSQLCCMFKVKSPLSIEFE